MSILEGMGIKEPEQIQTLGQALYFGISLTFMLLGTLLFVLAFSRVFKVLECKDCGTRHPVPK